MARSRNYNAEYARRKARGLAKGHSLSQVRGHPKAGEAFVSGKSLPKTTPSKISVAIKLMNSGRSMTASAKEAGISSSRFTWFLNAMKLGQKSGKRWIIGDRRPRRVPMIVNAQTKAIIVPGFSESSLVGHYHNDVRRFLQTQEIAFLERYRTQTVNDIYGKSHAFETNPNTLIRYALKDEPDFPEIYQIISPES